MVIILIKDDDAHKKRILLQTITNIFNKCKGKGLKHSQKSRWRPNGGCFNKCRNKLFNGKPTLRFGAGPFVFVFVVLDTLGAVFVLFLT